MYKIVIRPLIDYNVCPNFIRYLGSGENCSFDSVMRLLSTTIPDEQDRYMQFARNIEYMVDEKQISYALYLRKYLQNSKLQARIK